MAKQFKTYRTELVEEGKWAELVKSLEYGIYEIALPNYSALRALLVTISRVNKNPDCKCKFSTSTKYEPLTLRIEADLKK